MSDQKPPEDIKRLEFDLRREDAKRAHDQSAAFHSYVNEAAIRSSELTLRTGVVINGGAAVSVLAFIGGLIGQGKVHFESLAPVADSLSRFAWGVASAMLGMGLSYLVHFSTAGHEATKQRTWVHPYVEQTIASEVWKWVRIITLVLAILSGVASAVLFLIGLHDVRDAIAERFAKRGWLA